MGRFGYERGVNCTVDACKIRARAFRECFAGAEKQSRPGGDGLDPWIMPAVIGQAPGGLTYWQVVDLLHGLAAKANLAGFDIVEFMPSRDIQGLAALHAARIVCNVIGLMARSR